MPEVVTKEIKLRGAALAVMRERGDEVLVAGPAGTGKSFACLYKLHLMCLLNGACKKDCKREHEHRDTGMRALIVRKTHRSLSSTGLVTFREQVAMDAIKNGIVRWYGGSGEKPAMYVYDNGSVVVVGGMDNPDKIMSSEYDLIYAQEATELTREDWEKLSTRLRNGRVSFQQLLADCNPQQPSHWLKKRSDDGTTTMLYSRHEDNPRLFDYDAMTQTYTVTGYGRSYLERLDALNGVRKLRLRHGKWAAAEGIIYEAWRPDIHFTTRKKLPQSWVRIWAVDFGFTNPFVWQQWAIDDDGRMWLEREIYRTKRLVEDHAGDILRVVTHNAEWNALAKKQPELTPAELAARVKWIFPKPRVILCDHDAEDRATLERHLGMGTVAAWKGVSDGIQNIQKRLVVQPDGMPRLLVLMDSLVSLDQELKEAGKPTCFGEEIEGYVWKPQLAAAAGREKAVPDEPDKQNDHSMDTTRYAGAYLDLQPKPRVRWLG